MRLLERGPDLPAAAPVFNPWRQVDAQYDLSDKAPRIRRDQLRRYLSERQGRAKLLLIAEAPSYCGAKFCGIAMCCERLLLREGAMAGDSAFFDGPKMRTSRPDPALKNAEGWLERTASIVWETMAGAGFHPYEWVTWNAFAWHPHEAGRVLTNRTPTTREIEAGLPVLRAFLRIFPDATPIAVGRVCHQTLTQLGIAATPVRHPSYGGAPEFRAGVKRIRSA